MGVPRFVAEYRNYAQKCVQESTLSEMDKDMKIKALNYIYDMAYIGTITTTEAMADITEELMEL